MLDTLNNWGSVSGNVLKALVATNLGMSPDLRRYVLAALSPFTVYGVKGKLLTDGGSMPWDEGCYTLLDRLASRDLTGNAAKQELAGFARHYSPDAVELLNRCLNHDLRCGVGATLINNLDLNFRIPEFTCQLAQPGEAKRMKPGEEWLGCIKYDGMRTLIEVNDNRVNFWTRSGKPIPALDPLATDVLEVFGGGRVMLDSEGVGKDFLDTVSQLRRKDGAVLKDTTVLQIFDMVGLDDFRNADNKTYFGGPLTERLGELESMFNVGVPLTVNMVDHWAIPDWAAAEKFADDLMEKGHEGAIFKRASAGYIKRRTYDWLKAKVEDDITARIIGVYEGEAGKQFEGMLGGVTVEIGGVRSDVGMGWTRQERATIWAAETGQVVDSWIPHIDNKVIGRLIDIRSNGKNPSGALRHARKVKFRDVGGEIA